MQVKFYKPLSDTCCCMGHRADVRSLRRKEERLLETTEMRMSMRIKAVTLGNRATQLGDFGSGKHHIEHKASKDG